MNKNQKALRRTARATRFNEGRNEITIDGRIIAIRRRPPNKHNACKVAGRTAREIGERLRDQAIERKGYNPYR